MESAHPLRIIVSMVLLGTIGITAQTAAQKVISAGVAQSMLISKTSPVYPPIAQAAHVQGTVVLQGTISRTGEVEDLQVVSGPPLLQNAALEAVRTWRYRPFLVNGEPVEVKTTMNLIFTLPGGATPPSQPTAVTAGAFAAHQNTALKDPAFDIQPLAVAVEDGDIQAVTQWVNGKGVDVNTPVSHGGTLLYIAVDRNHPEIVGFLLDHGADANAKGNNGLAPLFVAANRGYVAVVSLLISHGADVNAKTESASTALHTAAYFGHTEIVKLLLSKNAELNAKDGEGGTPLHMAAEGGHRDTVEMLLAHNAAVNPLNNDGESPVGEARINFHSDIAQLLIQHGGTDPHAAANIKRLDDKIKQENEKAAAAKKEHEEYVLTMTRVCRIYGDARQACATAGDFNVCMQIKNTGTGFYKGSADTCKPDGTPLW